MGRSKKSKAYKRIDVIDFEALMNFVEAKLEVDSPLLDELRDVKTVKQAEELCAKTPRGSAIEELARTKLNELRLQEN